MTTSNKPLNVFAICLCGCLLCASAAPAPASPSEAIVTESTEEAAVTFLHKTFYSNVAVADNGQSVRDLIKDEIMRIGFNFESIANRTVEDWRYIVRSLFMSYYLKQKSMSERVTHLLFETLGIKQEDKPLISSAERDSIIGRIPAAVISRVDKWNERPMTRKFEDVVFIGTPKPLGDGLTAWSFTLEKPMASERILKLKLGIHLTPESRERATGMPLEVRRVKSLGVQQFAGKTTVGSLTSSLSDEIQVDITTAVKPSIYGMRTLKGNEQLELVFSINCPDCGEAPLNITYMVMDCKVRVASTSDVGEVLSRETRETDRLRWPFDNTTATEVFKNHPPGASFTKTQKCIIENVNRRYGQKSCCLMEFTYDMGHQGVVLAPKQLKISYCAGECHGQSEVHTPHSSLLQIVGHSQTSKLSHETKEDINLCCVANTYRDYQVLTIGRPPADSTKTSVQLKIIKDISAESCTCA